MVLDFTENLENLDFKKNFESLQNLECTLKKKLKTWQNWGPVP